MASLAQLSCDQIAEAMRRALLEGDVNGYFVGAGFWRKKGCSGGEPMAEPNPLKLSGSAFLNTRTGLPLDPTGGFGLDSGPSTPDFGGGGGGSDPGGLLGIACGILGISPGNCSIATVIAAGGAALLGLGDDDDAGDPALPGQGLDAPGPNGTGGGAVGCEGPFKVRLKDGRCVDIGAAAPGGDPLISGFRAVRGLNGAGFQPMEESRTVMVCPPDHVLGKDNVCYDHLPRSRRKWDPGMKPLLTGGDRAAIRKAARAARALQRSKKQLKKASRALDKVS